MVKLTIAKDSAHTTSPIRAYRMVSLAFLVFPGSPVDVMYCIPPTMMKATETIPATAMMALRMFWMTVGRSFVWTPVLLQPDAALISGETLLLLQMSSAKVCTGINVAIPVIAIAVKNIPLVIFLIFIMLLCGSY